MNTARIVVLTIALGAGGIAAFLARSSGDTPPAPQPEPEPASAASKLEAQWQMKKGDIFDVTYLHRFFEVLYHDFGLSRSYSVIPKQTVDRQQKTVNVTLRFVPKK